jgi:hypothetical protein
LGNRAAFLLYKKLRKHLSNEHRVTLGCKVIRQRKRARRLFVGAAHTRQGHCPCTLLRFAMVLSVYAYNQKAFPEGKAS